MSSTDQNEQSEKTDTEIRQVRSFLKNESVSEDQRKKIVTRLQNKKNRLEGLEKKLRKQEYDFTTVMEMANQIIARSVETSNLTKFINYIKSTFQGHFGVEDVFLAYRQNSDHLMLSTLHKDSNGFQLRPDDPFIQYLVSQDQPVSMKEVTSTLENFPELQKVTPSDVELLMPLTRNTGSGERTLQGILMLGPKLVDESYSDGEKQFLSLLGRMLAISLYNAELYQKSITDSLTGLRTRGNFDLFFKKRIQSLEQSPADEQNPLSVIMLDLDEFKKLNDRFGHQAGDQMLQAVSKLLQKHTREMDLVARYGGEEFIIVAPNADQRQGYIIAQRLRRKVEEISIDEEQWTEPLSITLSAGVSTYPVHARNPNSLIAKADDALYKAKEQGRNQVIVVSE